MFHPICKRQEIEQNGELDRIVVALDSFLTRDKPLRLFVAVETLNKPVETKFEQRGVERRRAKRCCGPNPGSGCRGAGSRPKVSLISGATSEGELPVHENGASLLPAQVRN